MVEYELNANGTTAGSTSYYAVPGARAVRTGAGLFYVLTDHLGSASVSLDSGGNVVAEMRYDAFGATRWSTGAMPGDRLYTGQVWQQGIGLYYFNARWYSPYLNRWTQPDSIVPSIGNPQSHNRYSMVLNNPVRYTDPTGHKECEVEFLGNCGASDPQATSKSGDSKVVSMWLAEKGIQDDALAIANSASAFLDGAALGLDLFAASVSLAAAGIGFTSGAAVSGMHPEVGGAGALLGMGLAEFGLQPVIQLANSLALLSTEITANSDVWITGKTSSAYTVVKGSRGDASYAVQVEVASSTVASVGLTTAGYVAPISIVSLPLQAAAAFISAGYWQPPGRAITINAWGTIPGKR